MRFPAPLSALFSALLPGLFMASICACSLAQSTPPNEGVHRFPVLEADDLNGRKVTLPADFPGDPTLVLVAFKQKQQTVVNEWVAAMQLDQRPDIPWVELPTINAGFKIIKGFVDNGMRSGITEFNSRARTISVYGQSDLMDPLGVTATSQVLALVVRPSGEILASVAGQPDTEKLERLNTALGVRFAAPERQ